MASRPSTESKGKQREEWALKRLYRVYIGIMETKMETTTL